MVNFIVYEKNNELKEKYEHIIFNFLGKRKEKFHIFDYKYKEKLLHNRNIYILGSKNINKALIIAKEIRDSDGWSNPIIIITNKSNLNIDLLNNKLLILTYLDNGKDLKNSLKGALCTAYKILTMDLSLNFSFNREIHKIPYNDILFIEKDNNQNYCLVVTNKGKIAIKDTINNLEKNLDSVCFMKTHRSCIVNLNNIKNYKINDNIIFFSNDTSIDLIARDKRKILKDKLVDSKITN